MPEGRIMTLKEAIRKDGQRHLQGFWLFGQKVNKQNYPIWGSEN